MIYLDRIIKLTRTSYVRDLKEEEEGRGRKRRMIYFKRKKREILILENINASEASQSLLQIKLYKFFRTSERLTLKNFKIFFILNKCFLIQLDITF